MDQSGTVFLICGKICCGKSTYSQRLRTERKAVLLSSDEITLALFGRYAGERHGELVEKTKAYLLEKTVEIAGTGIPVILDWGFWTGEERARTTRFFQSREIPVEWHYLDVPGEVWRQRMEKRNREIREGTVEAYPTDENLLAFFQRQFEPPLPGEIDVWVPGETL